MSDKCADPTFGIHPQALAIVALLAGKTPSFAPYDRGFLAHIQTFPWYNGREAGAAVTVGRALTDPCLIIAFGEARDSDAIFVEHWVEPRMPFNGPTVGGREEAVGDKAYERKSFDNGAVGQAADHIYNLMEVFFKGL